MTHRIHMRTLVLLFALLMTFSALLPAGCAAAEDLADLADRLAFPDLPQRTLYRYEEDSNLKSLELHYEGVTLRQLLRLMASLEQTGWCLKHNGAFRYASGLAIAWNQSDTGLALDFRKPLHAAEWPEQVAPCLALEIPVFPTGVFLNPRPVQEPLRGMESVALTCDGAGLEELREYEETLVRAGYVNQKEGALSLFVRGTAFVVTSWDETSDKVELYLGFIPVQYVPLPPWPDPLPENVKRMLPPLSAMLTVTEEAGVYRAQAQGVSLSELYRFYQNALGKYGWSEGSLEEEIVHAETGWHLRSLAYDSHSEAWTALIHQPGMPGSDEQGARATPVPTAASTPQPTPVQTEEPDLPYFVLTEGTCTQEGIMDTIFDEFGQSAVVADWEALKEAYGDGLPEALGRMGFENGQCAWLRARDSFNWTPDRHYFIQRFDEGAPSSFLVHDSVGTIYLGSWKDIPARVLLLVVKFGHL